MKQVQILALAMSMTAVSCGVKQSKLVYPETAKVDTVDVYFGTEVPDPYRWLENDTSAATAAWVEAQNKVTNGYLSQIPFREALLKRLTAVSDYEKIGTPFKKHGKYYFFKNDGLQNQSVLYVQDKLVYQNPAYPKRFYTCSVSEDETMLFLYESGEGRGNALYVKDLRRNDAPFVAMATDMDYQYSPLEVIGGKIYLFTNHGAPKNRIMVADLAKSELKDWTELVPESEAVLSGAQVIGGKLFLTYDKDASNHAYVYGLDGKQLQEIKLPSLGTVGFSGDKDDKECFFSFTSFTIPGATYKYDMDKNTYELFRAPKVDFDADAFVTEQVFYPSKDGTKIPMFLTYKKDLKKNGTNPVYLYGYGGFNISLNPGFSAMRIPFLENGGIYAQVNLRGGGEYGEAWHVAGTKMQKQNVFDDFIAAAEYLIAANYTNKDKIAIVGGSNGGLLVGACMTQRPDLFRVAIPEVGVMDMLRYHKFTIGWNWASDYGTSEDSKEMFEYLKGYSPLHNLKPGTKYPATMVTTADHDDRVVPAHSFKFAATLQACNDGTNPTLIRIDSKAGHGAGKPMSKVLEEQADIYSFIMYNLGMGFKE